MAEALIGAVAGPGTWPTLPGELSAMFTANGPAILAELAGEWLRIGPAEHARITRPVLLLGVADSPPELREPNEATAAALPDAHTVMVPGGHLIDPADPAVPAFVGDAER